VLGPNDIKGLDPLGLGPNPAMLSYFQQTYAGLSGNDTSVGDGFNYVGFRFRAPVSFDNNAFIARLDYHLTADGKHTLFWRGALQNIFNPQEPFLPGTPPQTTLVDHSKGFVVGYTAVLSPSVVNTFHWGFTRQSTGFIGNSNQEWNTFYGLDQSFTRNHSAQTPTHNLLDDFSWTKGKHTLQLGGNIGYVHNPRVSLEHSFNEGKGATNWMSPTGFANTGGGDPINGGFPERVNHGVRSPHAFLAGHSFGPRGQLQLRQKRQGTELRGGQQREPYIGYGRSDQARLRSIGTNSTARTPGASNRT
jgi:hypothetical protein